MLAYTKEQPIIADLLPVFFICSAFSIFHLVYLQKFTDYDKILLTAPQKITIRMIFYSNKSQL